MHKQTTRTALTWQLRTPWPTGPPNGVGAQGATSSAGRRETRNSGTAALGSGRSRMTEIRRIISSRELAGAEGAHAAVRGVDVAGPEGPAVGSAEVGDAEDVGDAARVVGDVGVREVEDAVGVPVQGRINGWLREVGLKLYSGIYVCNSVHYICWWLYDSLADFTDNS